MNPSALIFDAYGTLFDVASVAEACSCLTQDPTQLFSSADRTHALQGWLRVRPYPEVEPALDALAGALRKRTRLPILRSAALAATLAPDDASLDTRNEAGRQQLRVSMEPADVVLQAIDAVERRDTARQAELFHPRAEFHWPPSIPLQASWEQTWDRFQPTPLERAMNPRVVAAHDDEVVVLWQQRGVDRAGNRFECPVLGLYQVRDGKLTRAQMFYFDATATAEFLRRT